jgi:general secretion pathway protein N
MIPIPIKRDAAILIAVGLGAVLVWVAPVPTLKISIETPVMFAADPTLPTDPAAPAMTELTARPLFAQTRRPPPPVPAAVVAPPVKPVPTTNGMVLLGILRDRTKVVALVTIPGDQRPVRVVPGASLGAWVLKQISTDRLLLRSGNTDAELVLPRPMLSQPQSAGPQVISPFSRVP